MLFKKKYDKMFKKIIFFFERGLFEPIWGEPEAWKIEKLDDETVQVVVSLPKDPTASILAQVRHIIEEWNHDAQENGLPENFDYNGEDPIASLAYIMRYRNFTRVHKF